MHRPRRDRLASVPPAWQVTHGNGDLAVYLDVTFACSWVSGEARVGDDESVDVRWWPADRLPEMHAVSTSRGSRRRCPGSTGPASTPDPPL